MQGCKRTGRLCLVYRSVWVSFAVGLVDAVPARFLLRRLGEIHLSITLVTADAEAAGSTLWLVHACTVYVVGVGMG